MQHSRFMYECPHNDRGSLRENRAKRYVDTVIANQQPDGWICPCTEEERDEHESWPILLITKVLVQYHACHSERSDSDAEGSVSKRNGPFGALRLLRMTVFTE